MTKESQEPIVRLECVSKRYMSGSDTIHAIDNIDLAIYPGEFVCIMGPSGSGKSTLLNLIAGLSNVTEGKVFINGKAMYHLNESERALLRRSEIGVVFQFYNLHGGLEAVENVELPMLIAGIPLKERRPKATVLLEQVKLEHRFHHLPHELSGGERQRVGIARALANDPPLILADEPTGDLDHEVGREIMDLLVQLNREKKKTIIMVTHDSTLVREGFRLVRLKDGALVYDEVITDLTQVPDDFSDLVQAIK